MTARNVLTYERQLDGDVAHVVLNFANRAAEVTMPPAPHGKSWQAILSTRTPLPVVADGQFEVRALEAAIFKTR